MIAHFLNIGAALAAHEAAGIVLPQGTDVRCRLCGKSTEPADIERDGACRTWCHTVHRHNLRDVHPAEMPAMPWNGDYDAEAP